MSGNNVLVFSKDLSDDNSARVRKITPPSLFEKFSYFVGPSIFRIAAKSGHLLNLLKYIGEISSFLIWQRETFKDLKIFSSKSALYKAVLNKLKAQKRIEVLEFGVAHGYTTRFLIQKIDDFGISLTRYVGFDTFEGLTQKYRNFPKGSFGNDGKFPSLASESLFWCKGFVQDTLPKVEFESGITRLWIFDLDLYEPTYFVINTIIDVIQPEDICYFDEAFDFGEFKIINEILLAKFDCEYIGTNGQALALQVKGKKGE